MRAWILRDLTLVIEFLSWNDFLNVLSNSVWAGT
jgi:hypothetical protein